MTRGVRARSGKSWVCSSAEHHAIDRFEDSMIVGRLILMQPRDLRHVGSEPCHNTRIARSEVVPRCPTQVLPVLVDGLARFATRRCCRILEIDLAVAC